MKTVTRKRRWESARCFWQAGRRLSINRVFDCIQGVIFCVDQFGFGAGLTMSLLMSTSFLLQVARSLAEKGVI
jgi:hypothetical protein